MTAATVFEPVTLALEAAGVITLVIGFVVSLALAVTAWRKSGGEEAFSTLRRAFGGSILLGLEILVAADLVRTVTQPPSLTEVGILGIIVVIRTVLSMSIQIEIEGVLPWRRALTTSGASVIADEVRKSGRAPAPTAAED